MCCYKFHFCAEIQEKCLMKYYFTERCALEHPHHTLPLILSLAKYLKDEEHNENKTVGKFAKEVGLLLSVGIG